MSRASLALLSIPFLAASLPASDAAALPAFRGADGFGAITTGGRGGKLIFVKTLAPTGPGSLQAALDTPGPRIIVFTVSGVIPGDRTISYGDVTIAGQTAPGAGITLAGRLYAAYDADVGNIIVRHVRIRPIPGGSAGEQFDAARFSLGSRVILDHVSVSWGIDECIDMYEAKDVTLSWSIIAEGATVGHPEGAHNYGFINGPDGARAAVHHNLFAHQKNRNPAIANGPAEVRNNVVYDVRHGFVHHNPASGPFNIVGNVYVRGPSAALYPFYFDDESDGASASLAYHLASNAIDDPGNYVGVVNDPWAKPLLHPTFEDLYLPAGRYRATPFDFAATQPGFVPIETTSPATARSQVLARAGAFPRDVVDRRIVDEVVSRSGSWGVHAPSDLLQGLMPAAPPADTDADGIADTWELARGLKPNDGSDAAKVMPSGFSALEEYLDDLAEELLDGGAGSGGATSSGAGGAGSGGATSSGAGGAGSGGATSSGAGSGGATSSGAGGAGSGGATSSGAGSGGATSSGAGSGGATSSGAGGAGSGGATSSGTSSGGRSTGDAPADNGCTCTSTGAGGASSPVSVGLVAGVIALVRRRVVSSRRRGRRAS
jgi:pectate lyase